MFGFMRKARILELADFVGTLPMLPSTVDMSTFEPEVNIRPTHFLWGWGLVVFKDDFYKKYVAAGLDIHAVFYFFPNNQSEPFNKYYHRENREIDYTSGACELLGLNYRLRRLFYPEDVDTETVTPKQAAAALRNLVKYKHPMWGDIIP